MRKLGTFLLVGMFAVTLLAAPTMAADKKAPDKEAAFKKLDKDGNGKLTEAEFVGKKDGEAAEKAKKRFARLDKDKSGDVSLEEFKATAKKKDN